MDESHLIFLALRRRLGSAAQTLSCVIAATTGREPIQGFEIMSIYEWILHNLGDATCPVVLDIGAHHGQDSEWFLRALRGANVCTHGSRTRAMLR